MIDKILKLVRTLITTDNNFEQFLIELNTLCKADSSYIFEQDTIGRITNIYKYETNGEKTDIQMWFNDVTNGLGGYAVTHKIQGIGYLVLDNPRLDKTPMVVDKISEFVGVAIINKRRVNQLYYESCIDKLTSLKNRNELLSNIESLKKNPPTSLGIIYVDVNSLKQINDTLGHEAGDKIIQETAHNIKYFARDKSYRFGGDEFIVVMDDVSRNEFRQTVRNIQKCFSKISNYTVSIGYCFRNKNVDIEEQLNEADEHMYEQKQMHYKQRKYDRRGCRMEDSKQSKLF